MDKSSFFELTLSLGEQQLTKLTNDSLEIRMRALDQVEKRFMRCLKHGTKIDIKPVMLMKQLIRWFGITPPTAVERVLSLMLELMSSKYSVAVMRKIPADRLVAELNKIRKIIRLKKSTRGIQLLDDLQSLVVEFHNDVAFNSPNECSPDTQSYTGEMQMFIVENFHIKPEDFEIAWSCGTADDVATMKSMLDSLTIANDVQLEENLTNVQIKLCDYPAEQLCQPPYLLLQLLHLQLLQANTTLLHVDRVLFAFVKQLQRRLRVRNKNGETALTVEGQQAVPQQLRMSVVLRLLLSGCLKLLGPPLLKHCSHNWHLIELSIEVIKTFGQLGLPIPLSIVEIYGTIVPELFKYCTKFNIVDVSDVPRLVEELMIARLESMIFNGVLLDVLKLSMTPNGTVDKTTGQKMLQPIKVDSCYLTCVEMRMQDLYNLCGAICSRAAPEELQMCRLKQTYSLGLDLLRGIIKLQPMELLKEQRELCFILVLLGSETLMNQLIQAMIKCTSFYITKPELRQDAESLIKSLFDLPVPTMLDSALSQLKQPVVDHFHAFMDSTTYMTGCNNLDLAKNHIFGLPVSTELLRYMLIQAWRLEHATKLQEWCIDFFIMLVGLAKLVPCEDFNEIFKVALPVIPLLICRAIKYPHLQHMLWELLDPDSEYLDPPQILRGNVCFMFHPDAKIRKDAIGRLAYLLMCIDHQNKYRPATDKFCLDLIAHDICVIQPPIEYYNIFCDRSNMSFTRSVHALLQLLETPDLKPYIRKSTLVQLNALLQNWEAVETLTAYDGAYVLCLKALHDPLLRAQFGGTEDTETLLPAVDILLKVLFHSKRFRHEFKDNAEILDCLLRCIFLLPHDAQLRAGVSICIFQLIFHEHIVATSTTLTLDIDVSSLEVPVSYELDVSNPLTPVTEGIAVEQLLLEKQFGNNEAIQAQYWRIFIAHCVCGSSEKLTLSQVHELDISESMKLTPTDLALVKASQVHEQLQKQLDAASNCTSHETLIEIISSIQIFLVMLHNDRLSTQSCNLWQLMNKYLRFMPGNKTDVKLYIALVELCLTCLRHRLPDVLSGLHNALISDPHHSFLEILRDGNVSLNLLHLVTNCLVEFFRWQGYTNNDCYGKLLEEMSSLIRKFFEERKLQHVRCVLAVLRHLTEQNLNLDLPKIGVYIQHFMQLSSNLRTTTQTGAQWQRDCLLIISQLFGQAEFVHPGFQCKLSGESKAMRYLLGLCSHADTEVRTLSWVTMAKWIKSIGPDMTSVLLDFNDFLPGGLAACCFCTMMDTSEVLLVRELSGRVFELLIPHIGAAACSELLMYHKFLKQAHMSALLLQSEGAESTSSFEIITCCVSICIKLIVLNPEWCKILCNHSFFNALSDMMKMAKPKKPHCAAYLELCAGQICNLYALCYKDNFEVLQRSICRDPVLLDSFFTLINDVLEQKMVPESQLIKILKMVMVFCKDTNAYTFLVQRFTKQPQLLFYLILYGLNPVLIHRGLQRYTLMTLSLLLIKSQNAPEEQNLLKIFETYVEESQTSADEMGEEEIEETDTDKDDKEYNMNALKTQFKILSLKPMAKQNEKPVSSFNSESPPKEYTKVTVLLYHSLDQLFELHYPGKTYSFLQAPTKSHVQICEVLGNLLKQSAWAANTARSFKLMERIFHLLQSFLDDGNVVNGSVYVRRVGSHKLRDIINNLIMILNMLMHWQNSPNAVVTDKVLAARIVSVLVRLWPWLSYSTVLRHMTILLTTLLTEYSLEICKQTSQMLSGQSHSLLQLMVRVADHETTKKTVSGDKSEFAKCCSDSIIEASLRVMVNCCSCAEGRLSLSKMRVLDMFDTILPATNSSITKVNPDVMLSWLGFWEVFSRYELGNNVCHFQALLNLIRRSPPLSKVRLRCLRIMRNMCFRNPNHTEIINNTSFAEVLWLIMKQPVKSDPGGGDTSCLHSYEEHHLVVLCLWKLFGFAAKRRAMLRGTKLMKDLTILLDQLGTMEKECPQEFQKVPFALNVKDLLVKLFESLQA